MTGKEKGRNKNGQHFQCTQGKGLKCHKVWSVHQTAALSSPALFVSLDRPGCMSRADPREGSAHVQWQQDLISYFPTLAIVPVSPVPGHPATTWRARGARREPSLVFFGHQAQPPPPPRATNTFVTLGRASNFLTASLIEWAR